MAKKHRTDPLAIVHETAAGLHQSGVNSRTMRQFDKLCLTPVKRFTPKQLVRLRERAHVSQAVFAHYLNVSPNTISQWERGDKVPSGPSLKLLSLAEANGVEAIA